MSQGSHQPDAPGLVGSVLGNYRITGELSSGGMGAVYRATHELLGRSAAVKLLRGDLTANAELVTRFFNEAKAASAIRHPGIIEVFDFGHTEDGRAYLVMELLDGMPLSRRLADRGRLAEVEAAQIVRGIASALTAAHGQGIVHRDLKPDNVFLVPDPDLPSGERPKVLDFGIAKLGGAEPTSVKHTQTGALMGTPLYMAPEQARAAGEIDHRADLYSLGCILYELLVGEPPFVASGAGEIIALQLFGRPEPPSARLSTISPDIERIVMRLLEKEPADRYQTAAELSDALSAVFGKLGVLPATPLPGAPRPPLVVTTHRTSFRPGVTGSGATLPIAVPTEHDEPRPRRSALPLVAGALTLVIAAVVILVVARGGSSDKPAPPARPPPPAIPEPTTKWGPTPFPAAAAGSGSGSGSAAAPARGPAQAPVKAITKPHHGDPPAGPHSKAGSPIEYTP